MNPFMNCYSPGTKPRDIVILKNSGGSIFLTNAFWNPPRMAFSFFRRREQPVIHNATL